MRWWSSVTKLLRVHNYWCWSSLIFCGQSLKLYYTTVSRQQHQCPWFPMATDRKSYSRMTVIKIDHDITCYNRYIVCCSFSLFRIPKRRKTFHRQRIFPHLGPVTWYKLSCSVCYAATKSQLKTQLKTIARAHTHTHTRTHTHTNTHIHTHTHTHTHTH